MPLPPEICLACHGPLDCNSGLHLKGLARGLAERGFAVTACVPAHGGGDDPTADGVDGLPTCTFAEYLATRTGPPALVHLWTPREITRAFHRDLCRRWGADVPYVVHLEDHEELLLRSQTGLSRREVAEVRAGRRELAVPPHLTHPARGERLLRGAVGVTALVPSLLTGVPGTTPSATFWPGHDPAFRAARPEASATVRRRFGVPPDTAIVTYTGNVHAANVDEVRSLYLAVALANRSGLPIRLLRTGADFVPLADHGTEELRAHAIELGMVRRGELPGLVHASDLLVQPGRADEWNRFRVPSKLPEYLASGRPVILPRVNLGEALEHGWNAIVLDEAIAETILEAFRTWLPQRTRLAAIGAEGAVFAERHLTWSAAADTVAGLYRKALASDPSRASRPVSP